MTDTPRTWTAEDYHRHLDDDVKAFIAKSDSFYPEDKSDVPIPERRDMYEALCAHFRPDDLPEIEIEDAVISDPRSDIPLRRYKPQGWGKAKAQILFFHGGGYVLGSLETHQDLCVQVADDTGMMLTAVDYALSPERPFPHDWQDAMAAFEHVAASSSLPIVTFGDSAGANLAAAVCHENRHHERAPTGQVLVYPGLGSDLTQGSFVEHADAPGLTTAGTTDYKLYRSGGEMWRLADPKASPLNATDFTALPPTIVFSGECDPLRDDGRLYCEKVNDSGGSARYVEEAGLIHGYLRARHAGGKAGRSFANICKALSELVF